jgi:hypothetical protein
LKDYVASHCIAAFQAQQAAFPHQSADECFQNACAETSDGIASSRAIQGNVVLRNSFQNELGPKTDCVFITNQDGTNEKITYKQLLARNKEQQAAPKRPKHGAITMGYQTGTVARTAHHPVFGAGSVPFTKESYGTKGFATAAAPRHPPVNDALLKPHPAVLSVLQNNSRAYRNNLPTNPIDPKSAYAYAGDADAPIECDGADVVAVRVPPTPTVPMSPGELRVQRIRKRLLTDSQAETPSTPVHGGFFEAFRAVGSNDHVAMLVIRDCPEMSTPGIAKMLASMFKPKT